ncbi:MAG TPA: NADP-dependent oxidoreductase, partial [Candidatus Angelobacter sp.]|nr:NADP-dependent oxidoreductase [Candidatus Angelobacter sp.]
MPRQPTILTAAAEVTLAEARKFPTKIFPFKVSNTNRQLRLQSRPKGLLAPGDLQLAESPVPELKDGQALARVKYLSIDP